MIHNHSSDRRSLFSRLTRYGPKAPVVWRERFDPARASAALAVAAIVAGFGFAQYPAFLRIQTEIVGSPRGARPTAIALNDSRVLSFPAAGTYDGTFLPELSATLGLVSSAALYRRRKGGRRITGECWRALRVHH
jgi:hypothetical protein